MKYAWIENDIVRDVCQGIPSDSYTEEIASYYDTQVADGIIHGAVKVNDVWTNPEPLVQQLFVVQEPNVVSTPDIKVSPIEFKLLFTYQERIAIKAKRANDPILEDFYSIVDDPRLTSVNLSLKSTQDALGYLAMLKLVTKERLEVILAGIVV